MRRRFSLLAGLAAVAIAATACSSSSSPITSSSSSTGSGSPPAASNGNPGAPVTITLESYMPTFGPVGVTTLNGLVNGFEAANPNIKVKIIADTSGASSSNTANYQREAAAGTLPDVGQVVFDGTRFAVSSLGAQNLDSVEGKNGVQSLFGGSYPYAEPVTKLAVVNGGTYGIPWTLSTPVLFYNPQLFKQAGLNPADPPATWAEVDKDAQAIKAKTSASGINVGCIGVATSGNDWCLQGILGSDGGSVISANGASTTFDSPQDIAAVTTLQGLAKDGSMVDLTSTQMTQEFAAGKLAMAVNTSALQGGLLTAIGSRFTLMDAPMPGFPGHMVTPTNSGSALMIFTKDTAKQRAAWKLMAWLTDPESETTITEKIGYPPLRTSLAAASAYLKPFADAHPLIAANIAQLQRVSPWESYPGPNFLQIETLLIDAVSKAIFQGASAPQSLTAAQSQASGLVQG
jgi:multiple sugar transport system substrate-binding protein